VLGQQLHVLAAVAQGREGDREDVEAVVEVLAELALRDRSSGRRFVAAITRTSTLKASLPPMRVTFPVSRTRRSLTCSSGGISVISSRKSVPRFARSK
jgi:hypothetical protein